jgi:hypothetical protein
MNHYHRDNSLSGLIVDPSSWVLLVTVVGFIFSYIYYPIVHIEIHCNDSPIETCYCRSC